MKFNWANALLIRQQWII